MEFVGKYRVIEEIGQGATGRVVRAYDEFHQRWVAVKISHPPGKAGAPIALNRRMFYNEASLAGRLEHPHIARIYDADCTADQWWVAMEYVPGGTLGRFVAPDHRLAWHDVLEIGLRCARALHHAASLGVIHRDIKPDNILVRGGLDVAVSDFGAAMINNSTVTQIAQVGTPSYMSPQQLRGHPPDVQSDIFSLGVVLYRLLAGMAPFRGQSAESVTYQIANVDPPPVGNFSEGLTPEGAEVVMRMLAKETDARQRDWDEVSIGLAGALFGRRGASERLASPHRLMLIRDAPLFQDFSDSELWEVLRVAGWPRHAPGERIVSDGEAAHSFFVLLEGQLGVTKGDRLLNTVSPGECFGEMPLADPTQLLRTATVTALTPALCLEIDFADFERFSAACARRFHRALLRLMAIRIDALSRRVSAETQGLP